MANVSTKMPSAESSEARRNLYALAIEGITSEGYEVETIGGGVLVHLGPDSNGNLQYAVLNVSVKNADKFDVDFQRSDYAEKQRKAAEKAEAKAAKEMERAEAARKKAAEADSRGESVE